MRFLVFCFTLVTIISCTPQKEKNIAEIHSNLELVNKGFADNTIDTAALSKTQKALQDFVQSYPDDTLAPGYLFELGMLYQKQRRFDEAISTFDQVYTKYPDAKRASNAVFLQGFLYANVLNQYDKAKEKYQLYLDKYGAADAKMTNDVQMELKNLGKTPDEILKEIEAKADTSI